MQKKSKKPTSFFTFLFCEKAREEKKVKKGI
jgi:hypothetical protein